jgi:hypothetical protein
MRLVLNTSGGILSKPHHFDFPSGLWSSMDAKHVGVPELASGIEIESFQLADASVLCRHDQLAPVTRRYQPEPAALEELIEVLYRLLVDVPVAEPATASAPPEPTCFSLAPE